MKTTRYSDSQILAILKQTDAGTPVPVLYREDGMSSATVAEVVQEALAKKW